MTLENGLIRCLRRGSSPRVSESVKIDLFGPTSVHDHGDGMSYFCDLGFYGHKPIRGYLTPSGPERDVCYCPTAKLSLCIVFE